MATKADFSYSVAKGPNPKTPGQFIYRPVPKLAAAKTLDDVIEAAAEAKNLSVSADIAKSVFRGIMSQMRRFLGQGIPCVADEFFRVKPSLTGTVSDYGASLTSANKIKCNFTAGTGMKLSLESFSAHNVEDTGKKPRIRSVQNEGESVGTGSIVNAERNVDLVGSNLQMGPDDTIEAWELNADGTRKGDSYAQVWDKDQVTTNSDILVEFGYEANDLTAGKRYEFVLVKRTLSGTKTITTTSNGVAVNVVAGE